MSAYLRFRLETACAILRPVAVTFAAPDEIEVPTELRERIALFHTMMFSYQFRQSAYPHCGGALSVYVLCERALDGLKRATSVAGALRAGSDAADLRLRVHALGPLYIATASFLMSLSHACKNLQACYPHTGVTRCKGANVKNSVVESSPPPNYSAVGDRHDRRQETAAVDNALDSHDLGVGSICVCDCIQIHGRF
jgi:hypothetical protein